MDKITRIIIIVAAILIIGIVIAAAFVFISQKPDEEKIIGTWKLESILLAGNPTIGVSDFEIEFKSDGTYDAGIYEGTWQIKDGKLQMTNFGYSTAAADGFKYKFTNDDNRLTLYNDDSSLKYEMIFSKKTQAAEPEQTFVLNNETEKFIGTWRLVSSEPDDWYYKWEFYEDGDFYHEGQGRIEYNKEGTYFTTFSNFYTEGNQLYVVIASYNIKVFNYEFADDNTTLVLSEVDDPLNRASYEKIS